MRVKRRDRTPDELQQELQAWQVWGGTFPTPYVEYEQYNLFERLVRRFKKS